MKTLLVLSALLTAALAAVVFPPMKPSLVVIPFVLLAVFLTGCTTGLAAKINKLPDGRFATATMEETDKFTSTTIKLEGVTKDNGTLAADRMAIDHTNPWVTKFHYEVTGYYGQLSAAEKKKLLPPANPNPAPEAPKL